MNNENGKIWFSLGLDDTELKAQVSEIKKTLQSIGTEKGPNSTPVMNYRTALDTLNGTISENLKRLKELKAELASIEAAKNAAGKSAKDMSAREMELSRSISELTALIKLQQRELISEANSVDQLRSRLLLLTRAYNSLSDEQRKMKMGVQIARETKQTSEALTKALLQESKMSTENARQKLLEAQAREKNAKAADIEQKTIDRLNKPKKVSQFNDAEFAAYAKRVSDAGSTPKAPAVNNTGNVAAINSETAAINNLSSAYQKQQVEKKQLVESNKAVQSSFFDISKTYSENAQYLATLQKELKQTQAAMKGKAGTTAELSAREKQLKADIKDVEIAMRSEYQAFISNGGSIDQLKGKLKQLQQEYRALSEAERKAGKGTALKQEITSTITAIKAADGEISGHTQKVKEYQGTMTKALSGTWSFLKYISYLIPGLGIAGLFDLAIEGLKALWEELRKNNGALDAFKQKVEITAEALKDSGFLDAKAKVAALKEELRLATEGKISAKKAIDDYNDSLGKATGGVASLGEMERKLSQSSDAYLQMLALKTKATIAYRKAAEEGVEADIEMNNYGDFGSAFMRFLKTPSEWFKNPLPSKNANPFQVQIDYADSKRKSESLLNKLGDDYQRQAAEIANKFKLNFFNDTEIKDGKSIVNRVYQDTKQLKELLDEVAGSKEKYQIEFGPKLESEELKINKYFDDLAKKVDEFNKDPKRKVKLTQDQIGAAKAEIESGRQYALGLSDDKERGDILVKQLAEQKKLYKEYEDFKTKYGEQAANDLYGSLTAKYKTYLDRVQAEYNHLEEKGKTGLNPAEANLFSKLTTLLSEAKAAAESDHHQWLAKALADYSNYEQKRQAIAEYYAEERKKVTERGDTDMLNAISEAEQKELKSLQASNSEKLASMEQFADGAVYLTKKAVQQQIEILQKLLDSDSLPADVTENIKKKIEGLNGLLNKPDSALISSQLDDEIKKKEAALLELAKSGDVSSAAVKRLNDELMNLKQEKAENSISGITHALSVLSNLSPALNDLSSALSETNNDTAKQIGGVFASLANGASDLLQTLDKIKTEGVTTVDAIGAAANFVISTIANIVSSAQAQKKAYEEFYLSSLAYQHDYNNALIEEIRLREGIRDSVFFTDYAGKIKAGLAAEIKSVNDYNEALKKLNDAQVITGTKKVRNWAAVGASTAAGAGAGAVIGSAGGPLSAVGAAIGAAVGFIGGMLKKRTVVNVYDGLLKTYPKLIDEQGNLNKAMAEAVISSGKIEGTSKENLQYLISMSEQYEKAREQIEGVISDLAGSLGNDLMSSLFDDWAAGGENAGKAFTDGVSKSLANIGKNLLFNSVFGEDFVKLQNEITQAFKTTGDPNAMVSSLLDFNKEAANKGKQFQNLLDEYARQLKAQGIDDVFGLVKPDEKETDTESTRQASTKGIAQASQDTANELNGRFTAIQGHTFQMNESLKIISPLVAEIKGNITYLQAHSAAALRHLAGIETNTARLEAIERDTAAVKADIRSVKTGIDDINMKGIKIKT